jgi:hypothetical protein
MPSPFYVDPAPVLSQGDIVDHVPWGLIEAPTTLCRPSNRQSTSGKAFYGSVADLKKPLPWAHEPEYIHGISWEGLAIVLWHGCQIDKWKNRALEAGEDTSERSFAAIAPVIGLENFQPADKRHEVTGGQHYSYFPLPAFTVGARDIPEGYADLRHIWSVRQSLLVDRLASIADTARFSLYEHLFTFFTRFRLDVDRACPTCGASVPLMAVAEREEP